jgi:hypothetical protein
MTTTIVVMPHAAAAKVAAAGSATRRATPKRPDGAGKNAARAARGPVGATMTTTTVAGPGPAGGLAIRAVTRRLHVEAGGTATEVGVRATRKP